MRYIVQRNKGKDVVLELRSQREVIICHSTQENRNILEDAYAIMDKHPRVQEIIISDKFSNSI